MSGRGVLAHWILACKNCGKDFKHSEIATELPSQHVDVRGWVDKPAFAEGGEKLKCPHCNDTSTYQRYMLRVAGDPL